MKIAHLRRTYLPKTEVFIYDQIVNSLDTEALILARSLENFNLFGGIQTYAVTEQLLAYQTSWADFKHKYLRVSTRPERKLARLVIADFRPDIFHAHFAVDALYYLFLKKNFKIPMVVSCYGHDVSSFPKKYFGLGARLLRVLWREADTFLAMSNDMKGDLLALGCPEEKIKIHYHGINLTLFKPVNRSAKAVKLRILFVGNFSAEKKGVEDLINAFAQVVSLRPNLELRLAGEGPLKSRYENLVIKLGLNEKVTFAGHVLQADLQSEFAAAHIFCHPSFTTTNGDKEGIPGTIVQAMATALPVVTTLHAGIPEIVEDGNNGFLVPEHSIPGISEALLSLIDNPQLRLQMGQAAARQAAQHADARLQALKLENIYLTVLNKAKLY